MRRSFAASVGVHLLIVVLAIVGLPSTPRVPDIAETPVVVDLVSLSEFSASSPKGEASKPEPGPAAASKPQAADRRPEPPPPPVEPKPEVIPPPQPEKAPPPEPEVTAPPPPPEEPAPAPAVRPAPPQPQKEPVVAEAPEAKVALPEPVAEPKPEPEPVPEPVVSEATPPPLPVAARKPTPPERPREAAEEAEPSPPAETTPAQPSKPREEADFASVSKAVRGLETPSSKRSPAAGDTAFEDRLARALGTGGARGGATGGAASPAQAQPVTSGEIDAVRRQIERCWNLPSGVKEADNVIVAVRVTMNADGTPQSATIEDEGSMQSNPHYRAAAESAVRAVLNPRCHPFKLPPEKYQTWKTMTLVFNPKEMFGT